MVLDNRWCCDVLIRWLFGIACTAEMMIKLHLAVVPTFLWGKHWNLVKLISGRALQVGPCCVFAWVMALLNTRFSFRPGKLLDRYLYHLLTGLPKLGLFRAGPCSMMKLEYWIFSVDYNPLRSPDCRIGPSISRFPAEVVLILPLFWVVFCL